MGLLKKHGIFALTMIDSRSLFYYAIVSIVILLATVVVLHIHDGSLDPPASKESLTGAEWCSYAERIMTDPKDIASWDKLPLAASHCNAESDKYSSILAKSDAFYAVLQSETGHSKFVDKNKFMTSILPMPFSPRSDFNHKLAAINSTYLIPEIDAAMDDACPDADFGPFRDRMLFSGDYSGKSLLLAVSSFYRQISEDCESNSTDARAQLLTLTASAFAEFFSADMLYSPAYSDNNLFQARTAREDLRATLLSLRALYPKVDQPSRDALLRIAGRLRLGFSFVNATRSAALGPQIAVLRRSKVAETFIARVDAISTASDAYLAGTVSDPTAIVDLADDDLSEFEDFHLSTDVTAPSETDVPSSDEQEEEEVNDEEEQTGEEQAGEPEEESGDGVKADVVVEDADYDYITSKDTETPTTAPADASVATNAGAPQAPVEAPQAPVEVAPASQRRFFFGWF